MSDLIFFWMGIPNLASKINFWTPGSYWILLGIEVTYPKSDPVYRYRGHLPKK